MNRIKQKFIAVAVLAVICLIIVVMSIIALAYSIKYTSSF